jgi:hypothetical protein
LLQWIIFFLFCSRKLHWHNHGKLFAPARHLKQSWTKKMEKISKRRREFCHYVEQEKSIRQQYSTKVTSPFLVLKRRRCLAVII